MRRFFGWIRDAWLILGICLVLLMLVSAIANALIPDSQGALVQPGAETPSRYAAPFYEEADWLPAYREEFDQARQLRWEPYVYWRRQSFDGRHINVDRNGVRKTAGDDSDAPLVLMLGGSAMWGSGSRDAHTIPSQLAELLRASGRPARIVNLGERAYVSGQSLVAYVQWLRAGREEPTVIVFYDGVNDVFAGLQSGTGGDPQNEWERARDFGAAASLRRLVPAALAHFEGLNRLIADRDGDAPDDSKVTRDIVAHYLATVDLAGAIARHRGTTALFFWQPTVFGKNPASAFEQSIVDASLRRHQQLQRAADASVAASGRDEVIALTSLFDGDDETRFMDYAHVSEQANALVARAMLPYVLAGLDASSE